MPVGKFFYRKGRVYFWLRGHIKHGYTGLGNDDTLKYWSKHIIGELTLTPVVGKVVITKNPRCRRVPVLMGGASAETK